MTPQQISRELDIAALRAILRQSADRNARRRSQLCSVLRWMPAAAMAGALVWWVAG